MHYPEARRPASVTVLFAFLTLFGFLGIVSGAMLMADPTGESMGFTSELLENMPFNSFLPVGLFLFFVYGIGGLLLAYGSLTRKELFLEAISERSGLHWSWTGGVLMMLTLIIWLAVEGTLIGLDFAATYFTISIGAVISVMLTMPATRGHLKVRS